MKRGKKHAKSSEKVESGKRYALDEAVSLIKAVSYAKFDESVDVVFRLGIDPRQADQIVRGTVSLPHGTGKDVKVLVFANDHDVANDTAEAVFANIRVFEQ